MIDIAQLKKGDKVHFLRPYDKERPYENGMVKEIPDHTNTAVRVVYHCAGDWDNFEEYTSALSPIKNLRLGWKHE